MVEFIYRKAREVFNFTKDRLHLLVPLGIWKIFRTDISCTPAASYFYYYVMPRSFLLDIRVFSLYLFRWRHWEISSVSSTISNFLWKHKLHLLELQFYDLKVPFTLRDIRRWSFLFASFQYSVDNLASFLFYSMICVTFYKGSFADSFMQFPFICFVTTYSSLE